MIRRFIVALALFAVAVSAMAQTSTQGQDKKPAWQKKVSKAARKTEEKLSASGRKTEEKVGTYTKKESKGTNHAIQRTERRHHIARKVQPHHYGSTHHVAKHARHHRRTRHHRHHVRHHRHHKAAAKHG